MSRSTRARNGSISRVHREGAERLVVRYWVGGDRRWELQPAGTSDRQARQRLAELMEQGRRGELAPRKAGPLATYATAWLADREALVRVGSLRAATYRDNQTHVDRYIAKFFGTMPLDDVTLADARAFQRHLLGQKLAPKTINGVTGTLRLVLRQAVEDGHLTADPAAGLRRLKVPRREAEFYEVGEAHALIKKTPRDWRALIAVAAFAGLRQGEILALRWSDIDWRSGRIRVAQTVQRRTKLLDADASVFTSTKTAAGVRLVPMLPIVRAELERHQRDHKRPSQLDLVFPDVQGGPLDPSNVVNRVYLPAVKRSGLRRIRFHDLRHTFVTYCAAAGVPLAKVGDWVGHADESVTRVYRHSSADSEEFALAKLAEFDQIRTTNAPLRSATTGNNR